MIIKTYRHAHGKDSTGSLLSINEDFFCYALEDQAQEVKVAGETRIPAGRYLIELRDAGGMNVKYSEKYRFHKGMLHLQDVPGFEWVYIHTGNTDDHTEGCILVGRSIRTIGGDSTVGESVLAYTQLYNLILVAIDKGEEIWIEVTE